MDLLFYPKMDWWPFYQKWTGGRFTPLPQTKWIGSHFVAVLTLTLGVNGP